MVEIKNVEVHGLERSIKASGNPMSLGEINTKVQWEWNGTNDISRGKKLGSAMSGSGHDNFLKGIIVQFDIKYPQYFTPELQRYHWIDIVSSQSKMHRLTLAGSKEEFASMFNKYVDEDIIEKIKFYVMGYNNWSEQGNKEKAYECFMKALSNLPMGYEMYMTISTNYLQLKTIYHQRKNHKLKEDWSVFCDMCLNLPMFKELTGV